MKELDDLLAFYQEFPNWSGVECRVDSRGIFGDYPLHVAATRCSQSEIEILVSAGANVNAIGEDGYTPLMNSVEQGCLDCVILLIDRGADPETVNDEGLNAKTLAYLHEEAQIIKYLEGVTTTSKCSI